MNAWIRQTFLSFIVMWESRGQLIWNCEMKSSFTKELIKENLFFSFFKELLHIQISLILPLQSLYVTKR